MKITTENIDKIEPITKPQRNTAGLTYETVAGLKGVKHLDRLNKDNALVLVQADGGSMNLESIALP